MITNKQLHAVVLALCPDASWDQDATTGEIVIYTGMCGSESLVPLSDEDADADALEDEDEDNCPCGEWCGVDSCPVENEGIDALAADLADKALTKLDAEVAKGER